jgi:5-formyltetrahydrofolate cyclo-ligase
VCFAEQVVEALPVEAHDVTMDHVVTDGGVR